MPAEGPPSPASAPPTPPELLRTASAGLDARRGERKKVIVIGAGMAGLVSAFELARQGHEPLVLEAQHRVGGRVRAHFAGEHCSVWHAWIQGALESGVRAAREIHQAPAPRA